MRQHWVRDIADFAKYALLKRLVGADLRLGVLWYLTTHADPNKPLVDYLSRPDRYRACDAALFDALCRLQDEKGDDATLEDVEQRSLLPATTVFYAAPLSTTGLERVDRRAARQRWFEDGCAATSHCDLIFLDPDTGVLPPKRRAENAGGEEYATPDEVIVLCERGKSVVCVQFGAPGNLEPEPSIARHRLAMLRDALAGTGCPEPWGFWWRDSHKVGLLVAPSARHAAALRFRTDAILADPAWSRKVESL